MSTDAEVNAIHSDNPNLVRDALTRRITRGDADLGTVALGLLYVGMELRDGLKKLDKPHYSGPRAGAGSI